MSGEAFGANSRFHPARAQEDAPLTWVYGPNGNDWSSTATVQQVAAVTGLSHAEAVDAIAGLERRGLLNRVAA